VFFEGTGLDAEQFAAEIDGKFMSGFVRATKPGTSPRPVRVVETKTCCGPECCS
jgi:hypothetical protein